MRKVLLIAVVAFAALLVMATPAMAATATDTVSVTATANASVSLTLDRHLVDFGALDPGVATGPEVVNVNVKSNANYTVLRTMAGQFAQIGLGIATNPNFNGVFVYGPSPLLGDDYVENYTANVPWTTLPGAYAASVTYEVVTQ